MAIVNESRYQPAGINGEIFGLTRDVDVDKNCLKLEIKLSEGDLSTVGPRTVMGSIKSNFGSHFRMCKDRAF
jgi:hypothetical protein